MLELAPPTPKPDMFFTIAATVTCLSVALLPAAAELHRVVSDRGNPLRNLSVPTRRSQVAAQTTENTPRR